MLASEPSKVQAAQLILRARSRLVGPVDPRNFLRKAEAEGGCGVIGIASSVPIEGRHLLQSLIQMRNRGNGKGGGAALAGIDPAVFGVSQQLLTESYLLAIAYLDASAQPEVEREHVEAPYEVAQIHTFPILATLDPAPPDRKSVV